MDEVILNSEPSEKVFEKISNPKTEGVYINGLFLEAAKWNKGSLDEPEEKQMYSPFPLLHMGAEKIKKGQGAKDRP